MIRFAASWVLAQLGHIVGRVMCWFDWAWLYPLYHRLCSWSVDLDPEGRIWKYVHKPDCDSEHQVFGDCTCK